MNKWLMYGGLGVGGLLVAYLGVKALSGGSSNAGSSSGYFPPTVMSSGGGTASGTGTDPTGTASTDNSIAQLLAGQLSLAGVNADTAKYSQDTAKAIALGQQSTDLATAKVTANASIEQSLAAQLGNIVKTFVSSSSKSSSNGGSSGFFGLGATGASGSSSSSVTGINGVAGTIGFTNGVISVDLGQTYKAANVNTPPAPPVAVHH